MTRTLFQCVCGAELDTSFDTVRCKGCEKIYHLSCPMNKGYFSQSLRRPHIRILTCYECFATTHFDEFIGLGGRHTSVSNQQKSASNASGRDTCIHSEDPAAFSHPESALHQSMSSIPGELVTSSNTNEPSDGEDPKKDCSCCGKPVSKKSKTLECNACKKTYYECAAYSPAKIQEVFEKNGWICVDCFIYKDDLEQEEKCRKCEKSILKKSKKLQCHRCNNRYHHECGAYASGELQELLERNRWLCKKCFACDQKEQACAECKKTTEKESKVLQCNACEKLFHFECAKHAPKKLQEWFEKKGWICGNCLIGQCDSKEKDDKNGDESKWKSVGKKVAVGAGLTAACLGGIPLAVGALGFGAAGVVGGSLAAAYQSAVLGGTIASGSAFAVLQSVGAAGLAVSTQAGIAAVCTAIPFLGDLKKKEV